MGNINVNETPVRTSKIFNINNISLENVDIPEQLGEFKNVEIINNAIDNYIDSSIKKSNLTYGLGEIFINQVNEKSNYQAKIEVNSKENEDIILNFHFDYANTNLCENIQITANENTKATLIIKYSSIEDVQCYHNAIIKVDAQKKSNLNIIIVNFMNEESNNFVSFENMLEEDSKVNYTVIDFGGKNSITNYYSNLIGKNADNRLNTIYLGGKEQVIDLNYIGELRGERSNIGIEVQGALKDSAKKHFKGTIDFKKGCKKSTGNENENCILLSEKAKSLALPMLLCSEEDVEGNHSCSAGKVGEKELFYIMSRGFSIKEAMKLMVRAKFNTILENIENKELQDEIIKEIDKRLD